MASEEDVWVPRKQLRDLLPEGSAGMPNLDAWEYEDLRDLEWYLKNTDLDRMVVWMETVLRGHPSQDTRTEDIITELQLYAANAAKGRRHRRLGEVDQALRFEARADDAYRSLPLRARW